MHRTSVRALILALLLALTGLAQAQPTIRYITPDAAASGMSVAVELIGDFGADGFYAPEVKVKLENQSDTQYVVLGPAVVSWNGRLAQVMLLVKETSATPTINLIVVNGSSTSNAVSFSIVKPFAFGRRTGGGVIGEGSLGTLSKRSTLVVDSMILDGGTWTVTKIDPDNTADGNQAFLPFRVLSKGPVRLVGGATLDVRGETAIKGPNGRGGHGGPGGGGGGGGAISGGGSGFTGGGSNGQQGSNGPKAGEGTGESQASPYWIGGKSLSGVQGGDGMEYTGSGYDEGAGGGTGHPFGTSGQSGIYNNSSRPGGYGAGSGGGQNSILTSYGGGGGGYASKGSQGGGSGDNGGNVHGNKLLAPLAGGSGGGSGNTFYTGGYAAGNGGGGGGALEITSFATVTIPQASIDARGGVGSDAVGAQSSGGGGGAGGAIVLGARDSIAIGTTTSAPILNISGGAGGKKGSTLFGNDGGTGGNGRIRLDGRVSSRTGNAATSNYYQPSKDYVGPSVAFLRGNKYDFSIVGYGFGWTPAGENGRQIVVYYRFPSSGWRYLNASTQDTAGSHTPRWTAGPIQRTGIAGDTLLYIAAMQVNPSSGTAPYMQEPSYLMTHASGMVARIPGVPKMNVVLTKIDFGKVRVGRCSPDTALTIHSIGDALLRVDTGTLVGPDGKHFAVRTLDSLRIPYVSSAEMKLAFCPLDTGCFSSTLLISSNDTIHEVTLVGCGIEPAISLLDTIDFGKVRVGACKDTTIVLRNPGTDTLIVSRHAFVDNNFSYVSPAVPMRIPPAGSAPITLRYCAPDVSARVTMDTIVSDARESKRLLYLKAQGKLGVLSMQTLLDFDTVPVGRCVDSVIILANTGDDTLFFTAKPNLAPPYSVVSPDPFVFTIAPSESRAITIRFCPDDTLVYDTQTDLTPSPFATLRTLRLSGRGGQGVLATPASLDYGCVDSGSVDSRPVEVTNVGSSALTGVTIVAEGEPQLAIERTGSGTIAPGESETFSVKLTASRVGAFTARVVVRYNDGKDSVTIPVSGRVSPLPRLILSAATIEFDTVKIGFTRTRCVSVMNPSCRPIPASQIGATLASGLAYTIEPVDPSVTELVDSSSMEFCVTYTVQGFGPEVDTLRFTSMGGAAGNVAVRGFGDAPMLVVAPPVLDFGDVLVSTTSPSQTATVANVGISVASIRSAQIVGPNALDFAVTGGALSVEPGDTVTYSIGMTPITTGAKLAWLELVHDGGTDSVRLTGRGVEPGLFVTRRTIDFGIVNTNPIPVPIETFAITNTGTAPVTILGISISGDPEFTFAASQHSGQIAPGDSIFVNARFNPTAVGSYTAAIKINDGSADQPIVTLLGQAVQPPQTSVYLAADTVIAMPGDIVHVAIRNTNDVTNAGIRQMTYRVQFDPMMLDLRTDYTVASPGSSVTRYSLGDVEFTVTFDAILRAPGKLSELEFEVLTSTSLASPITILSASFDAPTAVLAAAEPGRVEVVMCDTLSRVVVRPDPVQIVVQRPNPFAGTTELLLDVRKAGTVGYRLRNAAGIVALEQEIPVETGERRIQIDASQLPAGVYYLQLSWRGDGPKYDSEKPTVLVKQ